MFFHFPDDAHWSDDCQAVEFGVGIGDYDGVARIGRRTFQRFVNGPVTPELCVKAFHLHRTRFERIAGRKLRERRLTDDGNVEIDGRDLRETRGGLAEPALDRVA